MPGQWPEWVWEKRVAAVSNMAASGIAGTILTLVETDGTAATPHATSLRGNGAALRDVADAVHALCIIHGTFPGIVDQAVRGATSAPVGAWLQHAAERFAHERAVLARLTAAVGPLPSTPGQAASDAAVLTQRQALAMLARYPWPGNVRQLLSTLKVLLALADDHAVLTLDDLPQSIAVLAPRQENADTGQADLQTAIDRAGGNLSRAAKALGVSRSTLYRKLWRQKAVAE